MSVPEGKRGEGKFEVLIKTRDLAAYTINICCNENTFKPQYRDAITNKIIEISTDIFLQCWTANNIRLTAENIRKRQGYQQEAILQCNNLLALIQIAQKVFHLTTKRIKFWGEQIIEARNLIQKWKESDRKRI